MLLAMVWSLALSGGVGNLLDRVLHDRRVVDFMNLGIAGLRTGIFNVVGGCITIGVLLVAFDALHQRIDSVHA